MKLQGIDTPALTLKIKNSRVVVILPSHESHDEGRGVPYQGFMSRANRKVGVQTRKKL